MSLNYNPLPLAHVCDPIVDFSNKLEKFVVSVGAKHINWQTYEPVNSTASGATNVSFNIFPSYMSTGICRNVFLTGTLNVKFTGTNVTTSNFLPPFAPTDFPLNKAIKTATAKLNGQTLTVQNNTLFNTLKQYYYDDESLRTFSSTTSNYRDNFIFFQKDNIADPLARVGATSSTNILSRGAFPMRVVKIEGSTATKTSGSYTQPAKAGTIEVEYDLMEALTMLSPFATNEKNGYEDLFLFGLNNLSLNLNFETGDMLFNKIFCIDDLSIEAATNNSPYYQLTRTVVRNATGIASDTSELKLLIAKNTALAVNPTSCVATIKNLKLLVGEYSPHDSVEIPQLINYNYENFNYTLDSNINVGTKINSKTVTLGSLPSYIYIDVKLSKEQIYKIGSTPIDVRPWELPYTHFPVDNIGIGLNNMTNLLISQDKRIYYHSSLRNGDMYSPYGLMNLDPSNSNYSNPQAPSLNAPSTPMILLAAETPTITDTAADTVTNVDKTNFIFGAGQPIRLNFGHDIQLDPLYAPSVSESIKLNVTLTTSNPYFGDFSGTNPKPELLTIYQNEGVITITNGSVIVNESPLTKQDILNATSMPTTDMDPNSVSGAGGSWMSKLRKTIAKGEKSLGHVLRNLPEYADKAEKIAEAVGHEGAKNLVKGVKKYGVPLATTALLAAGNGGAMMGGNGGAMMGGRRMTSSQLANRL